MSGERISTDRPAPSIPTLVSDALAQVADLVRAEVRLAKTEMMEKVNGAVAAGASVAIGGVLLLAALFLFLQGIVAVLVTLGMNPTLAIFVVAVVTALVGYFVLRKGLNALSASNVVPDRTVRSLEKDAAVAKEQVR
jgi:VIT1/CCC1 family predicted Fe2+/Mn2+ transporter